MPASRTAAPAPASKRSTAPPVGDVAFLAYTSIFWQFGHAAGAASPGVAAVRVSTAYVPDLRAAEVPARAPRVVTTPLPDALARLVADVRAA